MPVPRRQFTKAQKLEEVQKEVLTAGERTKKIERRKIDPRIKEHLSPQVDKRIKRFQQPRLSHVAYDTDLADYICEQVSLGRSLIRICEEPGMPSCGSIYLWNFHDVQGFSAKWQAACDMRAEVRAEEIIEIADDGTNDWYEDAKGNILVDHDHIRRSVLRVDTRFKYLAKVLPRKYGESTLLKLADNEGNKLPSQAPTIVVLPVTTNKNSKD